MPTIISDHMLLFFNTIFKVKSYNPKNISQIQEAMYRAEYVLTIYLTKWLNWT